MYILERACEAQIAAQAGGPTLTTRPEARERTSAIAHASLHKVSRELAWPALLRKLDRQDPGYRS